MHQFTCGMTTLIAIKGSTRLQKVQYGCFPLQLAHHTPHLIPTEAHSTPEKPAVYPIPHRLHTGRKEHRTAMAYDSRILS